MPIHVRSPESILCASAKPNRLVGSSSSAGWTSLHLDHHEGAGEGTVFDTHPTDDLTLVVAVAGQHDLDVLTRGRWRSAVYQPGCAGMTPPGESTRLRWRTPSERQSFQTIHLYLPGSLLADAADEYRRAGQPTDVQWLSALSFRDRTIAVQASAMLLACQQGEPDIYAASAARWLSMQLLSRNAAWRHLTEDARLADVITDRRLARVIEYMSANLDRALKLDDLAREAGISVHHFGRRFRESMGMGPVGYLTTLRMAHAKLLMNTTGLAIAEVAVRCGYPLPSAFATAFLRHAGETASSYRNKRRL